MKSFQFKITCWIAMGFFAFMFFALVAFNIHAVHAVAHSAKKRMRTISRSILQELAERGVHDGPIAEDVSRRINEKLAFIDRERSLAYAVASKDRKVLYQTPGFNLPTDDEFLDKEHERLFLRRVESGEQIEDFFDRWCLLYRYPSKNFIIFVTDHGDYELLERLVDGFCFTLVLALVIALPSGYLLSRRILSPLKAIDATVREIRRGNLHARIQRIDTHDEISRLIDTLNLTFAELEESFGRIKQFSADAAHELNTPLTALRGNMEVCLGKTRNVDEYQAVLAGSVAEIMSLSRMVNDLLLLASLSNGQHKRQFAPVDCSGLVGEIIEQFEIIASEKNIRIIREDEADQQLIGDLSLLRRLCYNLIHNAIRFSHSGSEIEVSLKRGNNAVVLEVKDQGIGIKPEDWENIFKRFYQVDQSRNSGTGLGLSLAKWIVDLHGGQLEVESELGSGSLFRVTFPLGTTGA